MRGQMVAVNHSGPALRRVLRSDHAYIVPRNDDSPQRLVMGSTLEDAGFEKRVTPRGLEQIFSAVQEIAPSLGAAEIAETWSGLRPDTPDHLPILGPGELENVTFATGHYRNGILLAPITAKLVSEWVMDRRVSFNWDRFNPLRFAGKSGADLAEPDGSQTNSISARN
jgi:glycine oxidase